MWRGVLGWPPSGSPRKRGEGRFLWMKFFCFFLFTKRRFFCSDPQQMDVDQRAFLQAAAEGFAQGGLGGFDQGGVVAAQV